MDKVVRCVVAAAVVVVGFSIANIYYSERKTDFFEIEFDSVKKLPAKANSEQIITHSLESNDPGDNQLNEAPNFLVDTSVKNIGSYIDPDKPAPSSSNGEIINIGDYIDPDEDPALYRFSDGILRDIGEALDPDADPATRLTSLKNTKIIELGEYIDPDDYFLNLGRTSDGEINLGKVIHPDDVIEKIKD